MHAHSYHNNIKSAIFIFSIIYCLIIRYTQCSLEIQQTMQYVTGLSYTFDYSQLLKNTNIDCRLKIQAKSSQNYTQIYHQQCSQLFKEYISSQCYLSQISLANQTTTSLSSACNQNTIKAQKYIQIWNYQLQTVTIKLTFSSSDIQNQYLHLSYLIQSSKVIEPKKLQTVLLVKQLIAGSVLPYNLLDQKTIKVLVQQQLHTIPNKVYQQQPFIQTYWNEYGKDQIILPWLPYFSQCKDYKTSQRLMLNDIIQPFQGSSQIYVDKYLKPQSLVSTDQTNSIFSHQTKYQDKTIDLVCLSQLITPKPNKQQWFQNTVSSPYYFFKKRITREKYKSYVESTKSLENLTKYYYDELVPLQFQIQFDLWTQTPNYFQFNILVKNIDGFLKDQLQSKNNQQDDQLTLQVNQFQFVRAVAIAKYIPENQQSQSFKSLQANYTTELTNLKITINYLSSNQLFQQFLNHPIIYLAVMLIWSIICTFILYFVKRKINKRLEIKPMAMFKLMLFPAFKGYFFAFASCIVLIFFFYYIASVTNFQAIATTIGGKSLTEEKEQQIYTGRIGLTILLAGYFLLTTAIGQSFKVLTMQQAKIILEDAEYQNSLNKNINTQNQARQKSFSFRKVRQQNYFTNLLKDTVNKQQTEQQEIDQDERRSFIIKNMNSHRKYLLLFVFAFVFWMILLKSFLYPKHHSIIYVYLLIGSSILQKLIVIIYRYYIVKEMLYLYGILTCFQAFSDFFMMHHVSFNQFFLVSFLKILFSHPFTIGLQVLCDYLAIRFKQYMQNCQQNNLITCKYRFIALFKQQIKQVTSQSKYQKTIYYTALLTIPMCAAFARVFIFSIYSFTLPYNQLCKNYQYSRQQFFARGVTVTFAFLPLQIYILLSIVKFFNYKIGLPIMKFLEFQHFKFSNRKINWINDCFIQNRCILFFYREFQKFCLSSQMYLLSFTLVFALNTMMVGFKIIIDSQYVMYSDPALLVIVCFVWLSSNVLSVLLNFITIKLKFYSRKQQFKMRARLENVQKILKKSDFSEYLQVQAVKQYFLSHCKNWIVQNLTKILEPEDFRQNNFVLLSKYKHYKSVLKKRQIQKKKKQTKQLQQYQQMKVGLLHLARNIHKNNQNSTMSAHNPDEHTHKNPQGFLANINNNNSNKALEISQIRGSKNNKMKKTNSLKISKQESKDSKDNKNQNNKQLAQSKYAKSARKQSQQQKQKKIIKLPHKVFDKIVKPLVYSWLFTAKQFVFLKRLIKHIKQEKTQSTCQFCSMNIQLQAIQKHQFPEIVNEYRLLNVGRPFIEYHFVSYYRFRQEYITVCIQCKDKKLHMDRKNIEMSGPPAAILRKWIIMARGRILHRQIKTQGDKTMSIEVSKDHTN